MKRRALTSLSGLTLATSVVAVALSLPATSVADEVADRSGKGGLWSFSETNFSSWAGLSPEANEQRARLVRLEKRVREVNDASAGQPTRRAVKRAERELHAVKENLHQLADAPWEKRAALEARVANGLRLVEAQLASLEAGPMQVSAAISSRAPLLSM